jgi:hypothetical protein
MARMQADEATSAVCGGTSLAWRADKENAKWVRRWNIPRAIATFRSTDNHGGLRYACVGKPGLWGAAMRCRKLILFWAALLRSSLPLAGSPSAFELCCNVKKVRRRGVTRHLWLVPVPQWTTSRGLEGAKAANSVLWWHCCCLCLYLLLCAVCLPRPIPPQSPQSFFGASSPQLIAAL